MTLERFCYFVRRFWSLLLADWRREYGGDLLGELDAGLGWPEFAALVCGLSDEARFRYAVRKCPVKVSTPEDIARITGSYLGPGGGGHNDPAPAPEYSAKPPTANVGRRGRRGQ